MIYIAHRGLFQGPDRDRENHPAQITLALEKGYECEVDLWCEDAILYLGHDEPQYEISPSLFMNNNLWVHAKNLMALDWLKRISTSNSHFRYLKYFWHENDAYTLTSNNLIWTLPGNTVTFKSIMVMPEYIDPELNNIHNQCYAICSDWVEKIKNRLTS